MKILIAYDGSEPSDAAIVDLRRAGLPAEADVEILAIAEAPSPIFQASMVGAGVGLQYPSAEERETIATASLLSSRNLAEQAAVRLRADFPAWKISTEVWEDSPESAILRKAQAAKSDLIILGSHGRSTLGRLVLGSVSQHVLKHAECSVRISRHRLHPQERPIRLVIGVDGSDNASAAVHGVIARNWPADTEIRAIGVIDSRLLAPATAAGLAAGVGEEEALQGELSEAVHGAVAEFKKAGLRAAPQVLAGVPSAVLIAEAESWGADCIFVGACGLHGLDRMLLGNTAAAIAARAHCSVEAVR